MPATCCQYGNCTTVELQADTWEQARAQAMAIVDELKVGGLSDAVFDPEWDTMDNFELLDSEPRERKP
jgi:hypothetical protein